MLESSIDCAIFDGQPVAFCLSTNILHKFFYYYLKSYHSDIAYVYQSNWLAHLWEKKKEKKILFDDAYMESLDKNGRFSFCALKKRRYYLYAII